MNRPEFLAAVSATMTMAAVGQTPGAALGPKPVAYTGAIRMWEFNGGFPVVFASTSQDALRLAIAEEYYIDPKITARLAPADEPFTMLWEDGFPSGFEPDVACTCDQPTLAKYGCECDASTPSLTLPAATWAENAAARGSNVIGEFQG